MEKELIMEINHETAMLLWKKRYGKETKVKDFSGREMDKGSYGNISLNANWQANKYSVNCLFETNAAKIFVNIFIPFDNSCNAFCFNIAFSLLLIISLEYPELIIKFVPPIIL